MNERSRNYFRNLNIQGVKSKLFCMTDTLRPNLPIYDLISANLLKEKFNYDYYCIILYKTKLQLNPVLLKTLEDLQESFGLDLYIVSNIDPLYKLPSTYFLYNLMTSKELNNKKTTVIGGLDLDQNLMGFLAYNCGLNYDRLK